MARDALTQSPGAPSLRPGTLESQAGGSSTVTPMPATDAQALRAHWTLDPSVCYLNHGAFGACPSEVLQVQQSYRTRLEREPVRFMTGELDGALDASREALAAFLGSDTDGLVFVPNATTGVNAVLRSMTFAAGDELLVTTQGYNACSNAAEFVTSRAGARVVVADVPFPIAGPEDVVEAVMAAVSERTKLALLDHVTSPTGLVFPLEALIERLHERGVMVLVDGAHAPGMLPLDLLTLGADWYTGNCHKWICAPKGAAFLWARAERREGLRPTTISHGANSPRPGHNRLQDEFDWPGTGDPSPWLCVPTALEFMGGLLPGGWDAVRAHNHDLVVQGRRLLLDALGVPSPAPESMLGSLASVPLPLGDPNASGGAFDKDPVHERLFHEHRIEVPVHAWPAPPQRLLRISAQVYNESADYERLASALKG